ncbi:MAG: phage coat protein [Eubacteriales bacterium]|jgi:hypothetical protein|nr:phage coat protein [Eubacteriales bacterium]DAU63450.1 MAG TPA: major capsid protein [Caudoviricetes sp.]
MPNAKFDAKSFNPEAFRYILDRIPRARLNELRKSKALVGNPDIREVLGSQNGTGYARVAMRGLLDGEAVNYDGKTDITATNTKTFEQGVVVIGRAKAWVEKDFSYDITGGVDFMNNVAQQVADYWQDIDQDTILAVLKGVFSMTGTKNAEFVEKHTYTVSGNLEPSTLNTATAKACGDHKKKFSMIFLHSVPATNLENLNLLSALKYTDKDGITRDLSLYTWNGKLVIVDDGMPTEEGYLDAVADTPGAVKVVANSATPAANEIKLSAATPYLGDKTLAAGDYVVQGTQYTSYVLGEGSINFEDLGAKVPYEMSRDPKTNGGQDTLYTRQRKVIAPKGISYEKTDQVSLSPTDAELSNGANWALVHSGEASEGSRSYINHKVIPIARIKSRG